MNLRRIKIAGITYTDQCNQLCLHCHNKSKNIPSHDELSMDDWKKIVINLKALGLEFVSFGGGESFQREDFIKFVEFLRTEEIRVGVITNGYNLKRTSIPWNLFESVAVSLDYDNPDQYDTWRGKKGSFDNAIETIQFLIEHDIETEIISMLTNETANVYSLEKMFNLVNGLGIKYWKLNRYRDIGRSKDKLKLDVAPERYLNVIDWVYNKFNNVIITDSLIAALYPQIMPLHECSCSESTIRIASNGDISPCTFLSNLVVGNAYRDNIEGIWNNSPKLCEIRNRTPKGKCKNCNVWDICKGGCFASAYLSNGDFGMPDPQCWKVEGEDIKPSNVYQFSPMDYKASMRSYSCNIYADLKGGIK
ncbi:MAG: radical SAM protein [Fermentimonas sp.]|nr:radical SAM protein [Dysgonamonadaceae bacterium]MDD4697750.1 radical SAM protein [Fermentimonas sp.]